jgi:predicted phosphodiesterase
LSRVLVLGDTHAPAMHRHYIRQLARVQSKYRTDRNVHIGDVVDHHCISFHEKHPDSMGAVDEYRNACAQVQALHQAFPDLEITIGNHDRRVLRLNAKAGIPSLYLKDFNELYGTDSWKWKDYVEIDGVYYYHGEGCGGQHPAFNAAKMRMQPTVIGHYHSACGIAYQAGPTAKVWGMNVGCGVDRNHLFMQYGSAYLKKPIVACGVVIDGEPYIETMDLAAIRKSFAAVDGVKHSVRKASRRGKSRSKRG